MQTQDKRLLIKKQQQGVAQNYSGDHELKTISVIESCLLQKFPNTIFSKKYNILTEKIDNKIKFSGTPDSSPNLKVWISSG